MPWAMHLFGTVRSLNLTTLSAILAHAFLYYVSVFCIALPWLSYSVPGLTNILLLSWTTSVSLYTYVFCVFVDPGRVPDGWKPDEEGDSSAVTEVKKKDGGHRYCSKCQAFKPPRSHHCRVCQRCVLRMDHHCPYTSNCVGHSNYRAFLVFLLYSNAALIHCLGLIIAHFIHVLSTARQRAVIRTGIHGDTIVWVTLQVMAFLIALPSTVGLLMLMGWHIQMVLTNKTTIEYREGVTARVQGVSLNEHPYDLGTYHNLDQVLGEDHGLWACPPCAPTKGGTAFVAFFDMQSKGLTP